MEKETAKKKVSAVKPVKKTAAQKVKDTLLGVSVWLGYNKSEQKLTVAPVNDTDSVSLHDEFALENFVVRSSPDRFYDFDCATAAQGKACPLPRVLKGAVPVRFRGYSFLDDAGNTYKSGEKLFKKKGQLYIVP